jgi:hypothetical protein
MWNRIFSAAPDQLMGIATSDVSFVLLEKSQSSSRTMFMFFGASIPIRTELGPIRTIVIAMSSPIRIRSLVFLDSTNMFLSLCFTASVFPESVLS